MGENKTKATNANVDAYIASRASEEQAADCRTLMAMFERLTGQAPTMWGPSIVGYGAYRYTYASGRSGESPLAGFAIRGRELVAYLDCEEDEDRSLLARLGKHKMGKSCRYFKRLFDLDASVLEQLVIHSIASAKRRHG